MVEINTSREIKVIGTEKFEETSTQQEISRRVHDEIWLSRVTNNAKYYASAKTTKIRLTIEYSEHIPQQILSLVFSLLHLSLYSNIKLEIILTGEV